MRPRRFTIATILLVVAVIGLGLAGLMRHSLAAITAAATLRLAMLLVSILGLIYLRGSDRAFWAGFALFGWAFLLAVGVEAIEYRIYYGGPLGFLDEAANILHPFRPDPAALQPPVNPGRLSALAQRHQAENAHLKQFLLILADLAFVAIGGGIGRSFARRTGPAAVGSAAAGGGPPRYNPSEEGP